MSAGKPTDPEATPGDLTIENEPGIGSSVEDLAAALEESRRVAEQAREQTLRAAAETENVRRRAQRDVENAHKFAIERFASSLLPVVDSLERAVEAARAVAADGAAAAIADGVELSRKLFIDTLAREGLVQLDPVGEPFDPKLHQAVTMIESASAEPGSILQVLQKGYTLNGRLVRPAMAIVAKAPAKGPG
ncbi:MAG TPA: nucleotide exchange factor GrpE [Pseudomonadales bacterium]